ncbi:hypothetical protein ACLOJK_035866 [Asimina triloba]
MEVGVCGEGFAALESMLCSAVQSIAAEAVLVAAEKSLVLMLLAYFAVPAGFLRVGLLFGENLGFFKV